MKKEKKMSKSERMGTMPVPSLLIRLGAPLMLSMIVQALYNVVDSLFVSYIPDTAGIVNAGDKAINALTLAFPIQMLILALCIGTGVGVNAALSRSLGMGDRKTAGRIAGNSVFLGLCYSIGMVLFGAFGVDAYLASQTADAVIADMAGSYLRIISFCAFGSIWQICFERLLQATGRTTEAMVSQLVGALLNIILDPIFIFGYMGLPAMGVAGAAIATVIGQCASLAVGIVLHNMHNKEIPLSLNGMRPDGAIIVRIFKVGAPAIAMQALTSVMTYGMNLILVNVSATAVTAYGLYYKLQNFIFMPVFGLNNASIPIIAYNYGAGKPKRVRDTVIGGLIIASVIMGLGIVALQLFGAQIVSLFQTSGEAAQMCVTALRIITVGFLFVGANVVLQGACQALGNGMYSLVISLMRMVVIVLPLAWLLSMAENAAVLVWWAFPIAECVAMFAAIVLTIKVYRERMKDVHPAEQKAA